MRLSRFMILVPAFGALFLLLGHLVQPCGDVFCFIFYCILSCLIVISEKPVFSNERQKRSIRIKIKSLVSPSYICYIMNSYKFL